MLFFVLFFVFSFVSYVFFALPGVGVVAELVVLVEAVLVVFMVAVLVIYSMVF